MENLVRSAMLRTRWWPPWRRIQSGNQEAFDGQSVVDDFVHRLQVEKMGGTHKTAYAEHQPEADEPEQDGAEHEVYQIFISTLAVFLVRMNPASTSANPGCMKNTSMAASSIHTVLSPVASSPRARRLHRAPRWWLPRLHLAPKGRRGA